MPHRLPPHQWTIVAIVDIEEDVFKRDHAIDNETNHRKFFIQVHTTYNNISNAVLSGNILLKIFDMIDFPCQIKNDFLKYFTSKLQVHLPNNKRQTAMDHIRKYVCIIVLTYGLETSRLACIG